MKTFSNCIDIWINIILYLLSSLLYSLPSYLLIPVDVVDVLEEDHRILLSGLFMISSVVVIIGV